MSNRVLYIFHDGMEDIEALTPLDLLRRAGCDVLTLSVSTERQVVTRSDVPVWGDVSLRKAINVDDFDAVVIPGGPGVEHLRMHGYLGVLIDSLYQENKWVAAICAAPLVLLDQGLLDGRAYTAHPSTLEELPDQLSDRAVVVADNIVTARGAGSSMEFGLKLVELLVSKEKADEVAASICY